MLSRDAAPSSMSSSSSLRPLSLLVSSLVQLLPSALGLYELWLAPIGLGADAGDAITYEMGIAVKTKICYWRPNVGKTIKTVILSFLKQRTSPWFTKNS